MFNRTMAMPIALAVAVIGGSVLIADSAHAQTFRYGTNGRTGVFVNPGNRVITTSPTYSTNGRVYYGNNYNNGYRYNNGYSNSYRSYRPAYPNNYYYNSPGTYYNSPATYYSNPGYTNSPYNSYYGGYGYGTPYYGTPGQQAGANVGGAIGQAIGGNQGRAVGAAIGAAVGQ